MSKSTILTLTAFISILPACALQKENTVVGSQAALSWDWTQTSGGWVRIFWVKCSSVDGQPISPYPVDGPSPPRTIRVREFIAKPGRYRCIVSAANEAGESPPSNAVMIHVVDLTEPPDRKTTR